jgi:hypothetical protein
MKKLFPLAFLFVVGCAAPTRTINFNSQPQGAHVFFTTGANEDMAQSGRNFIGTTPFSWTTEVNGDGTFKTQGSAIPFYSDFVQSAVVFTAEPPAGSTNLFTKREVFHGNSAWQHGNNAPQGVFFDLTKP